MKKLIAVAAAMVLSASSMFAFGFALGGKALMGANIGDSFKATQQQLAQTKTFDFGGGGYVNLTLFSHLGVQAEINFIGSSLSFQNGAKTTNYDTFTMDVPLMLWSEFNLWKFGLGLGAGVNLSWELGSFSDLKTDGSSLLQMGAVVGADIKFHVTDHWGIVLGGRFIMNFAPKNATIDAAGVTEVTYQTVEFTRRSLYATLGAEFKLF